MRSSGFLRREALFVLVLVLALGGVLAFWLLQPKSELVVYVALDREYAEPILQEFERRTGLRVAAKYDTEIAKSVGLYQELRRQKTQPQADVFWNNEVVLTIRLKQEGVLAPYRSPNAAEIPAEFRDPDDCWAGLAARARVIVYNTGKVREEEAPRRVADLLDWRNQATIARPLAGTTFTHAAVLWARDPAAAREFFDGVLTQGLFVSGGNAQVRDNVADGSRSVGLTDTDDAYAAIQDGRPIQVVWPDQEEGGAGVLLIPNTVALLAGAPHPEVAKKLIDFLLSKEVEELLAKARSRQIPLKPGVPLPEGLPKIEELRWMKIDFVRAAAAQSAAQAYLQKF